MLVLGETADVQTAINSNRFFNAKYAASNPNFNSGPFPCTNAGFTFRRSLTEEFQAATMDSCTTSTWYSKNTAGQRVMSLHVTLGGYYYVNPAWVKTWFYVR